MEAPINVGNGESPESLERARVRRNQRNSRARKQAYVRDLEQRWSECVKLGAQATVEMQKEARRVAEENRLLRMVLHRQGFDDGAIQRAMDSVKQSATEGNLEQVGTLCEAGGGRVQAGERPCKQREPRRDAASASLATEDAVDQGSFWPWSAMAAPAGNSGQLPKAAVEDDMIQALNLHTWLNDLCDIKDAFGAEAYDDFGGDLIQNINNADPTAAPWNDLDPTPLAIHEFAMDHAMQLLP